MRNTICSRSSLLALLALSCFAATTPGAEITSVFEIAQPRDLPPGAPKYSDVCMRNLTVHPSHAHDPYDTIRSIREFHVTRLEWTYGLTREFLDMAHSMGVTVQGAVVNGAPQGEAGTWNSFENMTIENLDGEEVYAPWMRTWKRPLWGCVNKSAFRESRLAYQKELLDIGTDRVQVDGVEMNGMAVAWGTCFCGDCMEGFRKYLEENTTPDQRDALGIEDVGKFDYRAYLKEKGAPVGDKFGSWDGGYLKKLFVAFQEASTTEFHRWNRHQLNLHAGRTVPMSCNNSVHGFDGEYSLFDYAVGELWYQDARPDHIYEIMRQAEDASKMQVLTMPKKRSPDHTPEWERLTRQSTAMAYACGGNILAPFDIYLPIATPTRYYGKPEQYADLFGFVRGAAEYLDGYQQAYAGGRTITDAKWQGLPGPVQIGAKGRDVYVNVRVRPGSEDRAVIHLVDWSKEPQPFRLTLDPASFFGNRRIRWRLLTPAAYDEVAHERAEKAGDYTALVDNARMGEGMQNEFLLPALRPWAILVLEPLEQVEDYFWKPTILGRTHFLEEGMAVIRCATEGAEIRYTTDGTEPNASSALYTAPLALRKSTVIKARAYGKQGVSGVSSARFVLGAWSKNILQNGSFEQGLEGWRVVNPANDLASMTASAEPLEDRTGHAVQLKVEQSSGTPHHLRLVQDFTARSGGYYDLRLRARAEEPTTIRVGLQERVKPYRALRVISIDVDQTWREFSLQGYNEFTEMSCQAEVDVGAVAAGNSVWLDGIQVGEDWFE